MQDARFYRFSICGISSYLVFDNFYRFRCKILLNADTIRTCKFAFIMVGLPENIFLV
uniref:Uncharacterized protein n=1 Tax=Rhizophora mucronata TaxID=61149 RepID=A0A2P2Q6A2_RHIMU